MLCILFSLLCVKYIFVWFYQSHGFEGNITLYRDLLIVLPTRKPSIFRGIAVSLLRLVIGSDVEIDVVALNWVAHVRKQIAAAFK